MRISFELEDSQLLSERPEQRYTVLVDPSMQTVGELVQHIRRVLVIGDGGIKLLQGEYELPREQSIKLIDPKWMYTCFFCGDQQQEKRSERSSVARMEVEECQDSSSRHSQARLKKIRFHAPARTAQTSSEESSQESSEQPRTKLPPPARKAFHQAQRPKVTSIEDFVGGQTSFYFSDHNYYKDTFIQQVLQQDRWMPTVILLRFPKIKKLEIGLDTLIRYLRMYEHPRKSFELSVDGQLIRKCLND